MGTLLELEGRHARRMSGPSLAHRRADVDSGGWPI
jgi:hypothetical protein